VRTESASPHGLEHKRFRSGKGFLVHVAQTYDFVQPYLKGFHLAEEAWRPGRDPAGWPISMIQGEAAAWDELDDEGDDAFSFAHDWVREKEDGVPPWVKPVPRLLEDVAVLLQFFAPPTPVQLIERPVRGACYVVYGAGDASGEGFGSSLHPLGLPPLLRQGFWCMEASEESSNWRELRNLLDAVKVESATGRLVG
jgi:hypothetical protein